MSNNQQPVLEGDRIVRVGLENPLVYVVTHVEGQVGSWKVQCFWEYFPEEVQTLYLDDELGFNHRGDSEIYRQYRVLLEASQKAG